MSPSPRHSQSLPPHFGKMSPSPINSNPILNLSLLYLAIPHRTRTTPSLSHLGIPRHIRMTLSLSHQSVPHHIQISLLTYFPLGILRHTQTIPLTTHAVPLPIPCRPALGGPPTYLPNIPTSYLPAKSLTSSSQSTMTSCPSHSLMGLPRQPKLSPTYSMPTSYSKQPSVSTLIMSVTHQLSDMPNAPNTGTNGWLPCTRN